MAAWRVRRCWRRRQWQRYGSDGKVTAVTAASGSVSELGVDRIEIYVRIGFVDKASSDAMELGVNMAAGSVHFGSDA